MTQSPLKRFLRPTRPWVWLIALTLIYHIGGTLVLPQVLKHQLINISAERLDLSTEIDSISFDPYVFTLEVIGLNIADSENNSLLAFDSLSLNLAPSRYLFAKTIDIQSVDSTGLYSRIEIDREGQLNFEKIANRWAETSEPAEETPESSDNEEPPAIGVQNIQVNDAQIDLVDLQPEQAFELVLQNIQIDLENLQTFGNETAELMLNWI